MTKTYDPYTLDPKIAENLTHLPIRERALRAGARRANLEQIISVLCHSPADKRESALAQLKDNQPTWFYR